MKSGKYDRSITLLCPVCGNTDMEHSEDSDVVKCVSCGKEMIREILTEENGENIEGHVDAVKEEITNNLKKEFSDMLKKAFKGNKNIRIK